MKLRLAETAMVLAAVAGLGPFAKAEDSFRGVSKNQNVRSFPPDTNLYFRPVIPEDFDPLKTRGKAPAVKRPGAPNSPLGHPPAMLKR
jgi:hypothetical protein